MRLRGGALSTVSLVALAAVLACAPTSAKAWFPHGSGAAAACPYPTDNGCAAAPANGSFKDPTLLTSAQMMGQNSLLPSHPMTFNIPGVDYSIGYDKTITLKDPRTINDSVCQWAATFLDCSSTGSGVVNEVLDGYDFSGTTIGQSAAGIYAPNNHISSGSTITITNSKFALIPSGGAEIEIGGHFDNLVFKNNLCDGTNANSSSGFCFDSGSTGTGSWDIEYNVFTNQGVGRIAGGLTNNNFILKYNYIAGLNSLNTGNHGELMLRNCSNTRANCTAYDDYEGNFIVWPDGAVSGVNNATTYPSDGASDGVQLSSFSLVNNIIVTNSATGGNAPLNQALFNSRAYLGVVTMTGNWVDASGSDDCSISGSKSGGSSVTASQTGNVVTITALSASFGNGVEPNVWEFFRPGTGYTPALITSFGTGSGGTGSYNVNGPSQSVPSDSSWTLVPGYTGTPTLAPNWNLADPSHTGIPVAMGLNSPQIIATHCSPHY